MHFIADAFYLFDLFIIKHERSLTRSYYGKHFNLLSSLRVNFNNMSSLGLMTQIITFHKKHETNLSLKLLKGINNYIHYKVWDEITYPCLNFNGCTVKV